MTDVRDVSDVLKLHDSIVEQFGGLPGTRDETLLSAALERPFMGLSDGTEFFPTIESKAAVLIQSLIQFHPFVDGNKRTGVAITLIFLLENGYSWEFTQEDIVRFGVDIAAKQLDLEEITLYIQTQLIRKQWLE